jgi:4a-hydroxytetrahydrobiopterin dehydratase
MTEASHRRLSRREASEAVEAIGWRYLLGTITCAVPVHSMGRGAQIAGAAVSACEEDADAHLRIELRPHAVLLSLQDRAANAVTVRDVEMARRISRAVDPLRIGSVAGTATGWIGVHMLEIAIDAEDISAVRPFWKAVLAYVDEPGAGPEDAIVDPRGQLPTVWFQRMDAPRPQRNRIHLDVTVPHDEADARVKAALAAGGRLLDDSRARAFWVLADAEGNEACVCTWQDRD